MLDYLHSAHRIDLRSYDAPMRDHWLREVTRRVVLATETLTVEIDPARFEACREASTTQTTSDASSNVESAPKALKHRRPL